MKYRKKPFVIDAWQWFKGDKPLPCMKKYSQETINHMPNYKGMYFIETLEGNHFVSNGDYIIKGVNGEFYPCKPDIFKKTYVNIIDGSEVE